MGDADFDFENLHFIFIFLDPKFPDFQTGPGPGLRRAWVEHGRGGSGWAWAGLGWAWAGLGLCLFDVLNMFPPLMKKPPMFLVPWILEASFAFFASSEQASQLYFSESLLTVKHRTPRLF